MSVPGNSRSMRQKGLRTICHTRQKVGQKQGKPQTWHCGAYRDVGAHIGYARTGHFIGIS
eukprot:974443-Rhodomonas_salina.4